MYKCWSHSPLSNLFFHSHCYSSITHNFRYSSPPITPCLHSLLHLFSTLLIGLNSSAQAFKLLHHLHHFASFPFIYTHTGYSVLPHQSFIPLFSSAYHYLFRFSSVCCLLWLQVTLSPANITPVWPHLLIYPSPWKTRWCSETILDAVLLSTETHLLLLLQTSAPSCCPQKVLYYSNILFCQSRLPCAITQFPPLHSVIPYL